MATGPSPNDLTRQQLDELDALLQRMLSLPAAAPPPTPAPAPVEPVWRPATSPFPEPTGWRTDRPAAPQSPAPHLLPEPVPQPAAVVANPVALRQEPQPVAYTPAAPVPFDPPQVVEPVVSRVVMPVPLPAFEPIALAPAAAEPELEPPTAPVEPTAKIGVPLPLLPMYAANWLIEKTLGFFGPPGVALTSTGMKHLLGFAGVLLLAGAGTWYANGMGWISLPLGKIR